MKYLSASPFTVGIIHLTISIGAIVGLFYFELTVASALTTVISYVLYSCIGLGMMFHRYWTHRSFEFKNTYVKWLLTWFGLMAGRGSILGWVHVHREHHRFSDTDKDPHIRNMSVLKIFFPVFSDHGININKRLIKDLLTKDQIDINKYYVLLILTWAAILAVIDPWLVYFAWFLPVFITNLVWNTFIFYGHSRIGYQTYVTNDNSSNSWIFSLLLLGEGWHNNHHRSSSNFTTKVKWWEFDPIGNFIKLIKI